MMNGTFKLVDGKLVFGKTEVNEARKLRPVVAKTQQGSKERVNKMIDTISKILKRIKRGELKVDEEKADQVFEKVLDMLNKEQKIDAFYDEEHADKEDGDRDEIIELIYSMSGDKLAACRNAIKNTGSAK